MENFKVRNQEKNELCMKQLKQTSTLIILFIFKK